MFASSPHQTLIDKAKKHPLKYFSRPKDVFNHPLINKEDKIKILTSWELDCNRKLSSRNEGMIGPEDKTEQYLKEVQSSLRDLKSPTLH